MDGEHHARADGLIRPEHADEHWRLHGGSRGWSSCVTALTTSASSRPPRRPRARGGSPHPVGALSVRHPPETMLRAQRLRPTHGCSDNDPGPVHPGGQRSERWPMLGTTSPAPLAGTSDRHADAGSATSGGVVWLVLHANREYIRQDSEAPTQILWPAGWAHAAPTHSVTVAGAHRIMQQHRSYDRAECPRKAVAYRVLVEARHIHSDTSRAY